MTAPIRKQKSDQDPSRNWTALRRKMLVARFNAVPFPNWLGLKLSGLRAGEADISLRISDKHRQYQGIAHGGALAALADTAATFSALTILPGNTDLVTVEFKVNFLSAIDTGRTMARARVVRMGSRVGVAEVHIFGPTARRLILTGTFTMLVFPLQGGNRC